MCIEILDFQKTKQEGATKVKMNTRGVLKVDGFTDFNPEVNVQLSKKK
jgi:hypothetical protein